MGTAPREGRHRTPPDAQGISTPKERGVETGNLFLLRRLSLSSTVTTSFFKPDPYPQGPTLRSTRGLVRERGTQTRPSPTCSARPQGNRGQTFSTRGWSVNRRPIGKTTAGAGKGSGGGGRWAGFIFSFPSIKVSVAVGPFRGEVTPPPALRISTSGLVSVRALDLVGGGGPGADGRVTRQKD